ncbi:MAG: serine hydrolase domain-containing protein [Parvularcula sp.]|jgi:D-alanyl-D-alanine carboxypeptidase|nr:serine hydrolase domain-containing protein [Parvularcula sp.]
MRAVAFAAVTLVACQSATPPSVVEPRRVASETAFVEAVALDDGAPIVTVGGMGEADALYQLGSISKYACTLLALRFVDDGRLDLDAPLSSILPGWRSPAAESLTMRQLLSHRANLVDGVIDAFRADPSIAERDISALEAANQYALSQTRIPPDTAFSYTITNWLVVQAVLEELGGASAVDLLNEELFRSAGMNGITAYQDRLPEEATVEPSSPVPPIPPFLTCAGGVAASAEGLIALIRYPYDVASWDNDTLSQLTEVRSMEESYALGGRVWVIDTEEGARPLHWLSGSNGAFKSRAVYDIETGQAFAVVTNEDDNALVDARRDGFVETYVGSIVRAE